MGGGVSKACCLTVNKDKTKKVQKQLIKTDNLPMMKTKCQISKEDIHKIYILRNTIGKGYFSTVKLAMKKNDEHETKFAIKIIHKSKVDENLHNDFLNELQILESLDHPNVIKLFEVYEDDLNYYLVMEHLNGGDIFQRIEQTKNIDERFIAEILYKIISAINYCHSIGICHRDIKPENILFVDKTPNSDIKIIDFGLSKKFNSEHDELMHSFLGTPYFVAPEVIRREYDFNCDMWSIGATAFMLFTGYPPFPDTKREIVLNKILKENPNFNSKVWGKVSSEAKEFVESLLIKNPKKRLSPQQALFHPFFKKIYNEVHSAKCLDKEILKNLSKFQNPFKFKKLVLGMLANSLPRDELINLTKTFNAMDLDHEGFISMEELKKAFQKSQINLSDQEINNIIERIDNDKNGKLNYSEYLIAALNIKKEITHKQRLVKLFKNIDHNNTGYIDVNNLKTYIMRSGREVENVDEVLLMLNEVSKSNNSQLTIEEFMKIIEND
jgi:calcium-dependent protein kinase